MNSQKGLELAEKKVINTVGTVFGNALDFQADGDAAKPLYAVCRVSKSFVGSGTLQVKLQTSADGANYADMVSGPVFPGAELVNGKELMALPIPNGMKRYLRLAFVTSVAAFTAGEVSGWLEKDKAFEDR